VSYNFPNQECHFVQFNLEGIALFRMKTTLSVKPVQIRLNHGMDLIHDNYAKPQPIDSFDWIVVSSIIFMG
jgi:hypothetical protein